VPEGGMCSVASLPPPPPFQAGSPNPRLLAGESRSGRDAFSLSATSPFPTTKLTVRSYGLGANDAQNQSII
jgi:hypothetical protein